MANTKEAAKDRILKIVDAQALARMIERGLEDSQNDRTISHEEMGQRISSWTK